MQGTNGRRNGAPRTLAAAVAALALGLSLSACEPLSTGRTSAAPSSAPSSVADVQPTGTESDTSTTPDDGTSEPIPTVTADPLSPARPSATTPPAQPTPTAVPATAAATGTATTSSPTDDPGSVVGSCARTLPAYPVLEPGARGAAVRALQCFLDDADYGPVTVDGVYGPQTRAAVRRLEASLEGPPEHPGRIDAGTWVALIARSLGEVTLKVGSSGPDVVTLQRALRAAGATVTVDGRFGPQTKKAVQRLQEANRVGVDGIVEDETLFLLKMGATIG